jgi:RNA polymerase sigma-70 factor (ECF subfamily)
MPWSAEDVALSDAEASRLDTAVVAALFAEHENELRAFLLGVLRDRQAASDVLQTTFAKLTERGHEVRQESRKAWLFRVAFNEALLLKRKQAVSDKVLRKAAWTRPEVAGPADERAVRSEDAERVREALNELPAEQRDVVRMKIYEEKTFAVIAAELKIPLGTALARMRAGLEKLRRKLGSV